MYKRILLSLVAIATITASAFGQAPEGFKYQAVVRNTGNVILNNQAVGMQIEILQGGISGTAVYTESFAPTTNDYGLVNLEIGTGTTSDDFSTIDWASDSYFIRTSIDVTGGSSYVVMGTNQLMSVPYALHAKTAESVMNDLVNDADADPTNEIQDISLSGTNLTLSNGSTIDLSVINTDTQLDETAVDAMVANNGYITSPNDADADPTNEIQNLSLTGNILTITNNGAATLIDLSVYLDNTDTQLNEAQVDAMVANNGYITSPNDADSDPTNEIQNLSLTGNILTITNNGAATSIDLSVYLDNTDTQLNEAQVDAMVANNGYITSPNDADSDPTNEIQNISLSGTNLTISGGATINLSVIDTDTHIDSTGIAGLGFVAGSHKMVDYSYSEQATGRHWVDGREIYTQTFIRTGTAYPNWTVPTSPQMLRIVNVEYMLISNVPFPNSRTYNSSHAYVTWDNPGSPGSIVMTSADGSTIVQAGTTLTIYYTKL